MNKIRIFNLNGDLQKEHIVPETVLVPSRFNSQVVFEAVNVENQNRRQGTHKTKNKSEVSGTGKKPYKQKHTGRARQGSRRNPQFRGGGVVFGVSPDRNYCIKENKKVFKIALATVWDGIVKSGKVFLLDSDSIGSNIKTKNFSDFLKKAEILNNKILVVSSIDESVVFLSSRNMSNVVVRNSSNCSVRDLLNQSFLVVTTKSLEDFYKRLSSWK